jgi:hypothetical protein
MFAGGQQTGFPGMGMQHLTPQQIQYMRQVQYMQYMQQVRNLNQRASKSNYHLSFSSDCLHKARQLWASLSDLSESAIGSLGVLVFEAWFDTFLMRIP